MSYARRFTSFMKRPEESGVKVPKKLKGILQKNSGRSNGRVTVRGQGGRHKRFYREVDFKRNKSGVEGTVISLEYDPNRTCDIALIKYTDGEHRYILAPQCIKIGNKIISGDKVEIRAGNAMSLKNIPVGTILHNIELTPGAGGKIGRSAGVGIQLLAKEAGYAHLKMPSGETRMVN